MTFGVDLIIISMSLRDAAPQERLVWNGRLAQLGEHLPYKQGVTGSSPVLSTIYLARWLRGDMLQELRALLGEDSVVLK